MAALALFLVVTGGTALAAFVVRSNSDVKPNTISGANRPAGVANDNIFPGAIGGSDIAPGARSHKFEFAANPVFNPQDPNAAKSATLGTVGNLRLDVTCAMVPDLVVDLRLTNVTDKTGTMNSVLTVQNGRDKPPQQYVTGQFVGAGKTEPVDTRDDHQGPVAGLNASNPFQRVEGQVVFQTPGRVTTVHFHVGAIGSHCELYGTGVTSGLS
jgi:hypothetical protein